ncbi:MAG: glycine--tRNA ligase subunit beta [Proteobacteria bacterium]|nr:glycine--tRNA ligase subunit beta [Pseudomonadota bacterium]
MADFLLELLSEEIPARMQEKARGDLARLFESELAKAGLKAAAIETFSTPRRLALIARGLPDRTEAVSEELKGPRTSAPPQALEGFLRKTGLTQDQLTDRDGVWFAVIDKPGRATAEVLAEAIPAIVRAFPWPKSMRWGAASLSTESLRWVRPLQSIVALLGGEVVHFEIDGIASGAETVGHRFHHPGRITIGSAEDYAAKLRACHVIVDQAERESIIATAATTAAANAGLTLVRDEALLKENAGLTEWPVPLLGSFDPAYLEVPPEVIRLTMATNQKYFAVLKSSPARGGGPAQPVEGAPGNVPAAGPLHHQPAADGPPPRAGEDLILAPNFVCTANIEAHDGGAAIVAGNQKVLAARLSDAKFFWEQDLKVPLEEQAKKLSQIVFHEKLGTVADKVERVAKLARWLVEEGIVGGSNPSSATISARPERSRGASDADSETRPSTSLGTSDDLAQLAYDAARLCKADLVTGMVGEFPELQGVMGGYYARAQGYPNAVADAIRDHYKPVGQGDDVPTAPVTVAVSLADKLDSITQFFGVDLKPSGSKDPFALRRSALGVIALVLDNGLRFPLRSAVSRDVLDFFADRLKVQQREAGVRHDLIDAVFALGGEDDLVRLLARVRALQSFVETAEGRDLLAGYKRAANILKKESFTPSEDFSLSYTPEPEEQALVAALDSAEPRARAAIAAEDFEGAMAALASLRGPVDAFFEKVTVNDVDPAKREARLNLLARMRDAVHQVADFSRIEG